MSGRTTLKTYFLRGASPTEANFADLIDSVLVLSEDLTDSLSSSSTTQALSASGGKALADLISAIDQRVLTIEDSDNSFASNYYNKSEIDATVSGLANNFNTLPYGSDISALGTRIDSIDAQLSGFSAASHTHEMVDIVGLSAAIDLKADTTYVDNKVADLVNTINNLEVGDESAEVASLQSDIASINSTITAIQTSLATKITDDHSHQVSDVTDIYTVFYNKSEVDQFVAQLTDQEHTHVEDDITDLDKYTRAETSLLVTDHANLKTNPHEVTQEQIGLGKVQNLSVAEIFQSDEALLFATKAELQELAESSSAHAGLTNNPHSVTKDQVGLGNVPNINFQAALDAHLAAENPHGIGIELFDIFTKDETNERIQFYLDAVNYAFKPASNTDGSGEVGDIAYDSTGVFFKVGPTDWRQLSSSTTFRDGDASVLRLGDDVGAVEFAKTATAGELFFDTNEDKLYIAKTSADGATPADVVLAGGEGIPDTDGDGYNDALDEYPLDPLRATADGVDADGDGVYTPIDSDDTDASVSGVDSDGDGIDDALVAPGSGDSYYVHGDTSESFATVTQDAEVGDSEIQVDDSSYFLVGDTLDASADSEPSFPATTVRVGGSENYIDFTFAEGHGYTLFSAESGGEQFNGLNYSVQGTEIYTVGTTLGAIATAIDDIGDSNITYVVTSKPGYNALGALFATVVHDLTPVDPVEEVTVSGFGSIQVLSPLTKRHPAGRKIRLKRPTASGQDVDHNKRGYISPLYVTPNGLTPGSYRKVKINGQTYYTTGNTIASDVKPALPTMPLADDDLDGIINALDNKDDSFWAYGNGPQGLGYYYPLYNSPPARDKEGRPVASVPVVIDGATYYMIDTDTRLTSVDGYYPLYFDKTVAEGVGNGTYTEHVFNGKLYYMPNGVNRYEGNYDGTQQEGQGISFGTTIEPQASTPDVLTIGTLTITSKTNGANSGISVTIEGGAESDQVIFDPETGTITVRLSGDPSTYTEKQIADLINASSASSHVEATYSGEGSSNLSGPVAQSYLGGGTDGGAGVGALSSTGEVTETITNDAYQVYGYGNEGLGYYYPVYLNAFGLSNPISKTIDGITYYMEGETTTDLSVSGDGANYYFTGGDNDGTVGNPTLTLAVGDTFVLDNSVHASHPIQIKDSGGNVVGSVDAEGNYTFNPTVPGEYTYVCLNHASMNGTITVTAVALGPSTGNGEGTSPSEDFPTSPIDDPANPVETYYAWGSVDGPSTHYGEMIWKAGHTDFVPPSTGEDIIRIDSSQNSAFTYHLATEGRDHPLVERDQPGDVSIRIPQSYTVSTLWEWLSGETTPRIYRLGDYTNNVTLRLTNASPYTAIKSQTSDGTDTGLSVDVDGVTLIIGYLSTLQDIIDSLSGLDGVSVLYTAGSLSTLANTFTQYGFPGTTTGGSQIVRSLTAPNLPGFQSDNFTFQIISGVLGSETVVQQNNADIANYYPSGTASGYGPVTTTGYISPLSLVPYQDWVLVTIAGKNYYAPSNTVVSQSIPSGTKPSPIADTDNDGIPDVYDADDDGDGVPDTDDTEPKSSSLPEHTLEITSGSEINALSTLNVSLNTTSTAIGYSSSDESIAVVSEEGVITALKSGTFTLTVIAPSNSDYQGKQATQLITVSKIDQVIAWTQGLSMNMLSSGLTLSASASSGNPAQYTFDHGDRDDPDYYWGGFLDQNLASQLTYANDAYREQLISSLTDANNRQEVFKIDYGSITNIQKFKYQISARTNVYNTFSQLNWQIQWSDDGSNWTGGRSGYIEVNSDWTTTETDLTIFPNGENMVNTGDGSINARYVRVLADTGNFSRNVTTRWNQFLFVSDWTAQGPVTSNDGNTISPVRAGTSYVTASFDGNDIYNQATQTREVVVSKVNQSITWDDNLVDRYSLNQVVSLTASVSSGASVTFTSSDESVATISGSDLTIVNDTPGSTATITATAAETDIYELATATKQLEVLIPGTAQMNYFVVPSSFLPGDVVVKEISFGENSMHVLASDGTVWVAGQNTYGQLGTGSTDEVNRLVDEPGVVYDFNAAPVKVTNADGSEFNGVTQVVGGRYDTVFLKDDGTVWGCGRNEYGMIGGSSTSPTLSPTQYTYNNEPIQGITKIAAGNGFAMFLQSDGLAFGQGYNSRGQLNQLMANGERIDQIVDITCGGAYTSYLRSDGTVWGAGFSGEGALGNFNYNNLDVIQLMKGDGTPFDNVAKIFSGGYYGGHNHFILNNGEVWGVGSNGHGTLGTGEQGAFPLPNHSVPQQCIIQDVEHISHIMDNSLFLKNDGTIWYCGQGSMTYSQWQQPTGAYSTPTQLTHIPTVAEKLYSGGINHIGYTDQDNDAYYFGKFLASPAKIQDPWAHQPPFPGITLSNWEFTTTNLPDTRWGDTQYRDVVTTIRVYVADANGEYGAWYSGNRTNISMAYLSKYDDPAYGFIFSGGFNSGAFTREGYEMVPESTEAYVGILANDFNEYSGFLKNFKIYPIPNVADADQYTGQAGGLYLEGGYYDNIPHKHHLFEYRWRFSEAELSPRLSYRSTSASELAQDIGASYTGFDTEPEDGYVDGTAPKLPITVNSIFDYSITSDLSETGTYTGGSQITLTATPPTDYELAEWTNVPGIGTSTSNPVTFTMPTAPNSVNISASYNNTTLFTIESE